MSNSVAELSFSFSFAMAVGWKGWEREVVRWMKRAEHGMAWSAARAAYVQKRTVM